MPSSDKKTVQVFFALLRAGLWEKDVRLSDFDNIDFSAIYSLAEEQSVVGLIAAGLEHLVDFRPPKEEVLQFVGQALQLEQRNQAMNVALAEMVKDMRDAGIYTLVVKGQGVAQCYEKPLWRAAGDIDFYLSSDNFNKAKAFFKPRVDWFDPDNETAQNISMNYNGWDVEIHANQNCGLSTRIDGVLGEIHHSLFYDGNIRSYTINGTQIFLPSANNDVLIVFTHFLKHFYKGGLGLRQICDWCRLIWTYRDTLDMKLLEERLQKMGLMSEWKAFGAYAVERMGMPADAMPFYSTSKKWKRKAKRINAFVLEVGNMGHSRDNSFYGNKSFLIRKMCSFGRRIGDLCRHAMVFPLDSLRFFPKILFNGILSATKGVG